MVFHTSGDPVASGFVPSLARAGRQPDGRQLSRVGGQADRAATLIFLCTAGIQVAAVDRDREPLEALAASVREQSKASELLTIAPEFLDLAVTGLRKAGLAGG